MSQQRYVSVDVAAAKASLVHGIKLHVMPIRSGILVVVLIHILDSVSYYRSSRAKAEGRFSTKQQLLPLGLRKSIKQTVISFFGMH